MAVPTGRAWMRNRKIRSLLSAKTSKTRSSRGTSFSRRRDSPPKYVIKYEDPIFDPKFDWDEDARVWHALRSLPLRTEEVWPELVSHLGDDRH